MEIFAQMAGGMKGFQSAEVFNADTLLEKAACEKRSDSPPIPIHKGPNGHQFKPQSSGRIDQRRSRWVCVKGFVKLS